MLFQLIIHRFCVKILFFDLFIRSLEILYFFFFFQIRIPNRLAGDFQRECDFFLNSYSIGNGGIIETFHPISNEISNRVQVKTTLGSQGFLTISLFVEFCVIRWVERFSVWRE